MKININRNIFWTEIFVKQLSSMGLKNVCISPGSRSTPLTLSFVSDKKIKNYVHIDERSSAFFALGLSKATLIPTAVVCTSGTAAVELYPAIVEAYQQRIPLIICTADRPPDQKGRGANQTINQDNLFKNHIRYFTDAGLPDVCSHGIEKISSIAEEAYNIAAELSGPVHINFPFKKPFEPDAFTDEIDSNFITSGPVSVKNKSVQAAESLMWFDELIQLFNQGKKFLFVAGPGNYNPEFNKYCSMLAELTGSPVFADVYSQLRFGRSGKGNLISNYDSMIRTSSFRKNIQPDIIIQFDRTPTSKALLNFLDESPARRIMINRYGDWFDPSNKGEAAYAYEPAEFCRKAVNALQDLKIINDWQNIFSGAEAEINKLKNNLLASADLEIESKVVSEVINYVPSGTNLMISNSSPVRELDYFTPLLRKKIKLFYNRGASGIDGIVSTALGISAGLRKPVVLITGDLAFFYDITALLTGKHNKLPLIIILINNNGGGIFNNLPVARYKKIFRKYFITPHDLEFAPLVKSFGWEHKLIKTSADLRKKLDVYLSSGNSAVLEIKTNAAASLKFRNKYWKRISELLTDRG